LTTLYALKRLPDNLSGVLDSLDNDIAKVTDFNPITKSTGWLLSLDEERIPERTLTVILLMISGCGSRITLRDPAVDPAIGYLPGDIILKTRYGYLPSNPDIDITQASTRGKTPSNE
jgi:hypothetical protein